LGSLTLAFAPVAGVLSAEVALLAHQAVVVVDAARVADAAVVSAVDDAGFDASLLSAEDAPPPRAAAAAPAAQLTLAVEGMTCGACTSAAERALLAVAGVSAAAVTLLPAPRAAVSYDADVTGPRALVAALEDAGFEARPAAADKPTADGKHPMLVTLLYSASDAACSARG
jgi:Cu+-exporting ATPase